MDIDYDDAFNPFETNDGREQARRFARRFAELDFFGQCNVVSDASGNIAGGHDNVGYFCELISVPRDSAMFAMMLDIGDRSSDYESLMQQIGGYWLRPICLALIDDVEEIVPIAKLMEADQTEAACQLLVELKCKLSSDLEGDTNQ